ncbi:MAG: tetratricopeptide repeat protein [Akkermansia sp.]
MNLVAKCFLFAGMGGLLYAALPVMAAGEQSPAVVASSPEDSKSNLEGVASKEQGWQSIEAARKLWMSADMQSSSLEARKWSERYVTLLQIEADRGDAKAMVELGKIFSLGTSVFPANASKALSWFERAAEIGDANSQYHLGYLYGSLNPPRKELSNKWYARALSSFKSQAEKGDATGSFWYGLMHQKGKGTPVDYQKAYTWLTRAAEGGNLQAQILVAFMAREGLGCSASESIAFHWFDKAAEHNDVGAITETALCYNEGKGVAKNEVKGREILQRGARLSDPFALRLLAEMYVQGRGGAQDLKQGLAYYRQAASLGDAWSAVEAYKRLRDGIGVDADLSMGLKILRRSADELNAPPAVYELGCYYLGQGDTDKGAASIQKAAENGYAPAMGRLGWMCLTPGSGVGFNPVAAYHWLDLAAERGERDISTQLTWMIWGIGSLIVIFIAWFLIWMNRIINRKWAQQKAMEEKNQTKEVAS